VKFIKRKIIIGLIAILILLLSQYELLFTGYARFFTINNPTYGVNASIALLSGGFLKTFELYEKGYGKRLLLTTERHLNAKVAHLFPTLKQNAEKFAQALDIQVEFETVPSLKGGATTIFDKAYDLRIFCEKRNLKHLIIVAGSFQSRRALYAFNKVFQGSGIVVEVSAASNEVFNEENWWLSDKGIAAYLLEPIKFVVYLLSSKNVSFVNNH
jgi:hypothetical protein